MDKGKRRLTMERGGLDKGKIRLTMERGGLDKKEEEWIKERED